MDEATARYYQALNLDPSASAEEIYQAYRDLVRVWDPQRFANSPRLELKAEEKLNEIITAYHALEQLRARAAEGASEVLVGAGRPAEPAPIQDGRLPVADLYRAHEPPLSAAPVPPVQPDAATSDPSGAPAARTIADLHRDPEPPFSAAPLPPAVRPEAPAPGSNGISGEPPSAEFRRGAEPSFSAPPQPPPPVVRSEAPASGFDGAPPAREAEPATVVPTQAAPVPEGSKAAPGSARGSLAQLAGQSRTIRFAVAGAGFLLVLAAIFFVFEVLSGPSPRSAKGQEGGSALTLPPDLLPADAPARGTEVRPGASANEPPDAARAPRRKRQPAPVPEEAPRQVPTGTELMTPEGRAGVGKFRIINQSGEDAVARLASQDAPSVSLRLVYIQTGTEVNIGGIGTGVYFVTFSMGPLTSKPRTFGRQYGPCQFRQIQSVRGYESDQYQILLKPRK
jgi:DnaJ domain